MSDEPLCLAVKCETDTAPVSKIISIAMIDLATGAETRFGGPTQPSITYAVTLLQAADQIVHFSNFHLDKIAKFHHVVFDPTRCLDVQKTAAAVFRHQNNGIDAWAERLGYRRRSFRGADHWCVEADNRCMSDLRMIVTIYHGCAGTL